MIIGEMVVVQNQKYSAPTLVNGNKAILTYLYLECQEVFFGRGFLKAKRSLELSCYKDEALAFVFQNKDPRKQCEVPMFSDRFFLIR